jgi:hypothetical protein
LVSSDVGEGAFEEGTVNTIGLSTLSVLAINASIYPLLRNVGRPGAAWSHVLASRDLGGIAVLPLGSDIGFTLVVELELVVGRQLYEGGESNNDERGDRVKF